MQVDQQERIPWLFGGIYRTDPLPIRPIPDPIKNDLSKVKRRYLDHYKKNETNTQTLRLANVNPK